MLFISVSPQYLSTSPMLISGRNHSAVRPVSARDSTMGLLERTSDVPLLWSELFFKADTPDPRSRNGSLIGAQHKMVKDNYSIIRTCPSAVKRDRGSYTFD